MRWLAGLAPLEPVLVRRPVPAPPEPRRGRPQGEGPAQGGRETPPCAVAEATRKAACQEGHQDADEEGGAET